MDCESLMTHAMVTGVDLDADGKPVKWKVENSWGDKVGQKVAVASDAWMDEYTANRCPQDFIQLKNWQP